MCILHIYVGPSINSVINGRFHMEKWIWWDNSGNFQTRKEGSAGIRFQGRKIRKLLVSKKNIPCQTLLQQNFPGNFMAQCCIPLTISIFESILLILGPSFFASLFVNLKWRIRL